LSAMHSFIDKIVNILVPDSTWPKFKYIILHFFLYKPSLAYNARRLWPAFADELVVLPR